VLTTDGDGTGGDPSDGAGGSNEAGGGAGGATSVGGAGGAGASGAANGSGGATAACGDGQISNLEQCDDGNGTLGDGCDTSCTVEAGYQCVGQPSQCSATCGDGTLVGAESCDDDNTTNGDGCNANCAVESGFQCVGSPSVCQPACGDGLIVAGEGCDDTNALAGDGCSASCAIEAGFQCSGLPSVCTASCLNPAGGSLTAENGLGLNEIYCYQPGDDVPTRALKACESHFGAGNCCVITGGYQDQQYGECNLGGNPGSFHWHWDNHPVGHCEPFYVVGDVVTPGWCGAISGSFLD
jgi:cysteine-rich repeat protein